MKELDAKKESRKDHEFVWGLLFEWRKGTRTEAIRRALDAGDKLRFLRLFVDEAAGGQSGCTVRLESGARVNLTGAQLFDDDNVELFDRALFPWSGVVGLDVSDQPKLRRLPAFFARLSMRVEQLRLDAQLLAAAVGDAAASNATEGAAVTVRDRQQLLRLLLQARIDKDFVGDGPRPPADTESSTACRSTDDSSAASSSSTTSKAKAVSRKKPAAVSSCSNQAAEVVSDGKTEGTKSGRRRLDLGELALTDDEMEALFETTLPQCFAGQQADAWHQAESVNLCGNRLDYYPLALRHFSAGGLAELTMDAFARPPRFCWLPGDGYDELLASSVGGANKQAGSAVSRKNIRALVLLARQAYVWPAVPLSLAALGRQVKSGQVNFLCRFRRDWRALQHLDLSELDVGQIPLFLAYLCHAGRRLVAADGALLVRQPVRRSSRLSGWSAYLVTGEEIEADDSAPSSHSDDGAALKVSLSAQLQPLGVAKLQRIVDAWQVRDRRLDLSGLDLSLADASALPFRDCRGCFAELDLRGNARLSGVPAALGYVSVEHTERILLDGDGWSSPLERYFAEQGGSAAGVARLVSFARALLDGEQQTINELRLMVVGPAAVGKTSLVRCLRKEAHSFSLLSTDGVDLGSMKLGDVLYHTWDFGGQAVYAYSHQLFFRSHALYLLLVDLSLGLAASLQQLDFWLRAINARVKVERGQQSSSSWRLLLVGTHADRLSPAERASKSAALLSHVLASYAELPVAGEFYAVACPSRAGVSQLKRAVKQAAAPLLQRAPQLVNRVAQAVHALQQQHCVQPFVGWRQFRELLDSEFDASLVRAKRRPQLLDVVPLVLERLGTIVRLQSTVAGAEPLAVIIRPQFLAKLLASIVTTRHALVQNGVLRRKHLALAWQDAELFPPHWHPSFVDLLKQTDVLFELKPGRFLVPCLLPSTAPGLQHVWPPSSQLFVARDFWLLGQQAAPAGLLPRLIIVEHAQPYAHRGEQRVTVCLSLRLRSVAAPPSDYEVAQTLRYFHMQVHALLTGFYQLDHDVTMPCRSVGQCRLRFDDLPRWLASGRARCSAGHRQAVLRAAPDALFVDLAVFNWQRDFDHATRQLLGSGACGDVVSLLARDERGRVAVKTLKTSPAAAALTSFQDFQREAFLMSALLHPNIVRFHGVCLQPLAFVMELCAGGDLLSALSDPLQLVKLLDAAVSHCMSQSDNIARSSVGDTEQEDEEEQEEEQEEEKVLTKKKKKQQPTENDFTLSVDWQTLDERVKQWQTASRSGQPTALLGELHTALVLYRQDRQNRARHEAVASVRQRLRDLYRTEAPLLGRTPLAHLLKCAIDIARGMHYAHSLSPPLVHRDLKSPNCLLRVPLDDYPFGGSGEPLALVADLGMSVFGPGLRVESAGHLNPLWLAPEIVAGCEYSPSSDVYSFGVILWELCTRRLPWSDDDDNNNSSSSRQPAFFDRVRERVVAGERMAIAADVPADYARLIERCWQQDPRQRPSFARVLDDLLTMAADLAPAVAAAEIDNSAAAAGDVGSGDVPRAADDVEEPSTSVYTLVDNNNDDGDDDEKKLATQCAVCAKTASWGRVRLAQCQSCSVTLCQHCRLRDVKTCFLCYERQRQRPRRAEEEASSSSTVTAMSVAMGGFVWLGFGSGRLAVAHTRDDNIGSATARVVSAARRDWHSGATSGLEATAASGGMVWSASAAGEVAVWRAHPLSAGDYLESLNLSGYLQCHDRSLLGRRRSRTVWATLEEGRLQFFEDRWLGASAVSLTVQHDLAGVVEQADGRVLVSLTDGRQLELSGEHGDWPSASEWAGRLARILAAHLRARRRGGGREAETFTLERYACAAVADAAGHVALRVVRDDVAWTLSGDWTLREWQFDDPRQRTGFRLTETRLALRRVVVVARQTDALLPALVVARATAKRPLLVVAAGGAVLAVSAGRTRAGRQHGGEPVTALAPCYGDERDVGDADNDDNDDDDDDRGVCVASADGGGAVVLWRRRRHTVQALLRVSVGGRLSAFNAYCAHGGGVFDLCAVAGDSLLLLLRVDAGQRRALVAAHDVPVVQPRAAVERHDVWLLDGGARLARWHGRRHCWSQASVTGLGHGRR